LLQRCNSRTAHIWICIGRCGMVNVCVFWKESKSTVVTFRVLSNNRDITIALSTISKILNPTIGEVENPRAWVTRNI
jgi:hypothetical protein